jgi:hypothetical protein
MSREYELACPVCGSTVSCAHEAGALANRVRTGKTRVRQFVGTIPDPFFLGTPRQFR